MPRPSVEVERKRQILIATCAVVAERGCRELRIADVAREAGVSNGSVHYYFDSKEALLRAAFEFNFRASLARRQWISEKDLPPAERLRMLVESYIPAAPEAVQAWRVWVELWVSALSDPVLQKLNDSVYGEWRDLIVGVLREGQELGQFAPGDPVEMANELIGMVDGLAIQVLLSSRQMTLDLMRATCLDFVERRIIVT